jgi:hypothetical protein
VSVRAVVATTPELPSSSLQTCGVAWFNLYRSLKLLGWFRLQHEGSTCRRTVDIKFEGGKNKRIGTGEDAQWRPEYKLSNNTPCQCQPADYSGLTILAFSFYAVYEDHPKQLIRILNPDGTITTVPGPSSTEELNCSFV